MIRPKRKSEIETAISNNVAPTRSKSSNDLLLRIGKGYTKLQTRNKTTPAGRFFFAQTNTKPETYDTVGNVVQRGSTEYLITNGKARVLRRLSGDDYIYTRLGKQYFNAKNTHFLIHVPAVIKKAHSTSVGRKFMVPHNAFMEPELSVSSRLSEAQQRSALKTKVLAAMESLDRIGDQIVLYNDSDPVIYDPDGA